MSNRAGGQAPFLLHPSLPVIVGLRNPNGLAVGVPLVLGKSAVAQVRNSANAAGDATFQTLASVLVPGGLLGPNGSLRISTVWSFTNSANSKILGTRFGGSLFRSPTLTTTAWFHDYTLITNRNSEASQIGTSSVGTASAVFGGTTGSVITRTVNTTADQLVEFGGYWGGATASEAITLEQYLVELLPAA